MPIDARPTLAAPDDDPYLWLEEIEGERALAWVERRTSATLGTFGARGLRGGSRHAGAIYDRPDNIPYHHAGAAHLYNFWKDANNPRGLWRRTTLEQLPKRRARWDDRPRRRRAGDSRRAKTGSGAAPSTLPGTHDRAILSLSRGGSDAAVLREFDIETKAFVTDGFHSAGGQGRRRLARRRHAVAVERLRRRHGHHVRLRHERSGCGGAASTSSRRRCCSRVPATSMGLWQRSTAPPRAETVWFIEKPGFFDLIVWLGDRDGRKTKLDLPTDI